jgi:hypothetical protein
LSRDLTVGEKFAQTVDEPGASQTGPVFSEPKLRVDWEEAVSRGHIGREKGKRVHIAYEPLDDDVVALEKRVRFVGGKCETE